MTAYLAAFASTGSALQRTESIQPGAGIAVASSYYPTSAELGAIRKEIKDRIFGVVVPLLDGRALIAGGNPAYFENGNIYSSNEGAWNGHVAYLLTAELYDPKTGRMSRTGAMAEPRIGAVAILLKSGMVLIAGGENWTDTKKALATCELYDPASGTFSPAGRMTEARAWASGILLDDGRVLIAAGFQMDDQGLNVGGLVTAETYDPDTGKFTPTGKLTTVRSMYCQGCEPAVAKLGDGRVLFAGGINEDGDVLRSAEIYDPAAGQFHPTGAMVRPRVSAAATLLPDGKVLISDGAFHHLYGKGMGHPQFIERVGTPETFDPATGAFTIN